MKYLIGILILPVLFLSCHIDKGLNPLLSAVEGTLTFRGEWPGDVDEVRIIATTKFPPEEFTDLVLGELVPVDADTYQYKNYFEPGTYKIVGVAWREKGAAWNNNSICGAYYAGTDSLNPADVIVPPGASLVSGIDISVNRSKAKKASDATIQGGIRFVGAWPDSFESAMVVAVTRDPLTQTFSIVDLSYSNLIPAGTDTATYSILAAPGTYKAIAVTFFTKDKPLTMDDLYYSQSIGGAVIQDFPVTQDDGVLQGPDFELEIGPIASGLRGMVSLSGSWPDDAEEVRLIAAKTFPPAIEELIIGGEIPADATEYEFFFPLKPATYQLVGVVWRAEGTHWDLLSICGVYFEGEDMLAPASVTIADDEQVLENINMTVDKSKARKITDTKIAGSITFTNPWPEEFVEARVISTTVFQLFPPVLPTLLDLSFSEVIQPGVTSYDYEMMAFPGTFVATAVIFFTEERTLSIDDIFYSLDVYAFSVDTIRVEEDSTAAGPDFDVIF